MTLSDRYDGSADAFEGDRTIVWRSLPSNAKVTKATVTVTPAAASGGVLFEEVISFTDGQGSLGATKNLGTGFVEVDFHKRRTFAAIDGLGVRGTTLTNGANLQVDLGGLYVEINNRGAVLAPNDTRFSVPPDGTLPGLTVSKLKLTAAANPNVTSVVIRSVPTNVSVRIDTLAPFWTHTGELPIADSSPDFSTVLRTYLARAAVENGFYVVPLVLHSDTLARLQVDLNVEFVSQTSLQPQRLKEVVVPFDFDTLPKTRPDVLSVALPPNARVLPSDTAVKVVGAFNETRIAHGTGPGTLPPPYVVRISPSESQAQLIAPDQAIAATAVDVLIHAITASAQLRLDLREDLDGKPSGISLLPAPVEFEVTPNVDKQPHWVSAPLPTEFKFTNGAIDTKKSAYWLVLQSLQGEAVWSTQPADSGAIGIQHTLDDGLSWHYSGSLGASGPLDASFRLRNKPALFQMPVQLQVGAGSKQAPVSLDRFQPLARVDFTLDTSDFAAAFNQYLAAGVPAACPQGEHLINGDFEQWVVTGSAVGEALHLGTGAVAVATSSSGRWTYLADPEQGGIQIVDSICDELLDGEIQLEPSDTLLGLAVSPADDRIYAVGESNLFLVDAIGRLQIGAALSSVALAQSFSGAAGTEFDGQLAVSSDGARIYLALANRVMSIATDVIEQVARGLRPVAQSDITSVQLPGTPVAMALSPDQRHLYVATTAPAALALLDPISLAVDESGIAGIAQPISIGFTSDSKLALIVSSGSKGVQLIDVASKTVVGSISLADSPLAVIASSDSTRAYVLVSTSDTSSSVVPVDLQQMAASTPVPLGTSGESMAITKQGDRIYIAGPNAASVSYIPIGTRVPAEWFVTSGAPATPAQVRPVCFPQPSPFDLVVVFGQHSGGRFQANPVAAGFSQVVPVAGSCSYEFSFWGISDDTDAVAEIFWLDPNSKLLRVDTFPFPVVIPVARRAVLVATTAMTPLQFQRASLSSPPGASQAEVRFTAPAFELVALGKASLKATAEILNNSDFALLQNGMPSGWTLTPTATPGVSLSSLGGVLHLLNSSTGDAELTQTVAIGEAKQFAWQFDGRSIPFGPGRQDPQVELRFLKADGTIAGGSTILKIGAMSFANSPATGTTPAATAKIEIHLKAPSGTSLKIENVSLQTPQNATVPLTFVAHSPGELRVSKTQITYDVAPVPPPPVPRSGLATPTAPGGKPGDPPCTAHCPCCHFEQPIAQPTSGTTAAGRPVIVGYCPECGSNLVRPGGPLSPGALPIHFPKLPPHRPLPGQPAPHPLVMPGERIPPPLTAVPGMREERVRQLAEIGITSLEHLAAASPEDVARALKTVSPKSAAGFIERAKKLLAPSRRVTTKPRKGLGSP